jgi:VIT1/CCC1 family predicted Fe2+/Mn2+ transporter
MSWTGLRLAQRLDRHEAEEPGRVSKTTTESVRRVLEPHERISEVLFGLIMVLTFTGSLSVADAGRDDVRAMLIGALGCNLAWGIIDALLYLMGCLAERGRNVKTLQAARRASDRQEAREIIAGAMPPFLASMMRSEEFAALHERLKALPEPPQRAHLSGEHWRGALGVFLLVSVSTFPVAVPFLLVPEVRPALRISNAVAVTMLFILGYAYGRLTGWHGWLMGTMIVVMGCALVGLTIALGG